MSTTNQPIYTRKAIVQLIWPLLVEQFLNVLIGMVDVLMVSTLGVAAVSGVSLIDSLNMLIFQILFAVAAGGNVVIAHFLGAQDGRKAGKASAQLITLTVGLMCICTAFMVVGRQNVLGILFGEVEPDVMENALTYLLITSLSYPALALYNASAAGFRALGNTKTTLYCSLFMNTLNIIGNAIGIYVLHMGVSGVALPTMISRIVGGGLLFYLLQTRSDALHVRGFKDLALDRDTVRRILAIGIPNGIENGVFHVGKLILSSLVATLGTAAIAGYAVAGNLVTYLYLPGNALGAAMLTIVGTCLGADDKMQAKQYAKKLIILNYLLLVPICLTMLVGHHQLVAMYSLTGQSATYASGLLIAHTVCMIMWPIGFLTPYYFRASGRATFTMIVAISTMWIFRVALAYVFEKFMGKDVLWVWYAMFIDWVVRVVVYVIAFRRESRKDIIGTDILQEEA